MSWKSRIEVGLFVFAVVMSMTLFFAAFHNIDLMWNRIYIYQAVGLNITDASDCNIFGCSNIRDIYMSSITYLIMSYFIMLGIVAMFAVKRWHEKKSR